MSQNKSSSSASPGARRRASLTEEQIRVLLDVAAAAGNLQALENRLRTADPDLADTVRRIPGEPYIQPEALPSSRKIIEIWNELQASSGRVAQVSCRVVEE